MEKGTGVRENILNELRQNVPLSFFNTWYQNLDFIQVEEDLYYIPVPNMYYKELADRELLKPIEDAFDKVFHKRPRIVFKVVQGVEPEAQIQMPKALKIEGTVYPPPQLNENYTFEYFVVGPSNRLAYAAAYSVAESPAKMHNPLFIHGSVGLGKTHLLQAICHELLKRYTNTRILYSSCEGFVNDYISAVQRGKFETFRNKYRGADILIIDDIHFLANKEGSQEEFFHTFNTLHGACKQIVLSSDSPPKDIPTLEERLVSRFNWGFVARMDPPTYETRVAILYKKAERMGQEIPKDVIEYIAERVQSNIRDLESAINKIIFSATLGAKIDIELTRTMLDETYHGTKSFQITIDAIQQSVCKYYNISKEDLVSKHWTKTISLARHVGIYLVRQFTHYSLKEIGQAFGGKDHATIMYALSRMERQYRQDPRLRKDIEIISQQIRNAFF